MWASWASLLSLLLASAPGPAWRGLQTRSLPSQELRELAEGGKLAGSPPCMAGLTKVAGSPYQNGGWALGEYVHGADLNLNLEVGSKLTRNISVRLQLDRAEHEPCCKLVFFGTRADDGVLPNKAAFRVGFVLLASEPDGSALRGMQIDEALRGQGLSKIILGIWVLICLEAGLEPRTRTINKPLLSLSLESLGFKAKNRRAQQIQVGNADNSGNILPWKVQPLPPAAAAAAAVTTATAAATPRLRS